MMTDCQRVANDIGLLASQAREMVERESEDYDGLEEALDLLCDYALFLEQHLDQEVSR